MTVIITPTATFGPFKTVETMADRLRCDGTDLPMSVIGETYGISEDDTLAPPPPTPAPVVPQSVTMRQARLALLGAGLLADVTAAVNAAGDAAKIQWEYAQSVDRNAGLVPQMASALGMTDAQIDALFVQAATL